MYVSKIDIFPLKNPIFILEKDSIVLLKVVELQHYYKPKVVVLKGEDAIEVLEEYITELEYNKPEELSHKQAQVMIKLAKGLISTIEEEPTHRKNLGQSRFLPKLETTIKKCISKILEDPEEPINTRHTDSPNLVHHYPQPVNHEM